MPFMFLSWYNNYVEPGFLKEERSLNLTGSLFFLICTVLHCCKSDNQVSCDKKQLNWEDEVKITNDFQRFTKKKKFFFLNCNLIYMGILNGVMINKVD